MRLNQHEIDVIKTAAAEIFGKEAEVRLFGSRVDDAARGGDIDLMVELKEPVDQPARLSARFSVKVMRAMQGRKVDVILAAPNLEELPIHRIAREQGIVLSHDE